MQFRCLEGPFTDNGSRRVFARVFPSVEVHAERHGFAVAAFTDDYSGVLVCCGRPSQAESERGYGKRRYQKSFLHLQTSVLLWQREDATRVCPNIARRAGQREAHTDDPRRSGQSERVRDEPLALLLQSHGFEGVLPVPVNIDAADLAVAHTEGSAPVEVEGYPA